MFFFVFTVDVNLVGHFEVNDLVDIVSACSVHAKVTQAFLDEVPMPENYVLPVDHMARAHDPLLTSRQIQCIMSAYIPKNETNHLEILAFYHLMIEEFQEVKSMKQSSLLPTGDFSTHHCRMDLTSLYYLLRKSRVPGIPENRVDVTSYDDMLKTFLSRYYQ